MRTAKEILKLFAENNGEADLEPVTEEDPIIGEDAEVGDPNLEISKEDGAVAEDATGDASPEGGIGEGKKHKYAVTLEDGSDTTVSAESSAEAISLARKGKGKRVGSYKPGKTASAKRISEGKHFHTKIKQLEAHEHPVKVRLGLKEVHRMVENILNPDHPSPNPVDNDSKKILESASNGLVRIMDSMRKVQVRRKPVKK